MEINSNLERVGVISNIKNLIIKNKKIITWIVGILLILSVVLITYFSYTNNNKLLSDYENKSKSNFSNKDQFTESNDYDINYLVEQMIYKEFSPSDKKKYLNLPQILKEQLMIDYLIQKI